MRALMLAATAAALIASAMTSFAHDFRAGDIKIGHPWTRATPPSAKVGGGYLSLTNKGSSPDRLLGGTSPLAGRVEVHTMAVDNGVMTMRPLPDGLEIPAGETVELAPGGYHLMLFELTGPIRRGDMVSVTLRFEKGGSIDVELAAGEIGSKPEGHGGSAGAAHGGND